MTPVLFIIVIIIVVLIIMRYTKKEKFNVEDYTLVKNQVYIFRKDPSKITDSTAKTLQANSLAFISSKIDSLKGVLKNLYNESILTKTSCTTLSICDFPIRNDDSITQDTIIVVLNGKSAEFTVDQTTNESSAILDALYDLMHENVIL